VYEYANQNRRPRSWPSKYFVHRGLNLDGRIVTEFLHHASWPAQEIAASRPSFLDSCRKWFARCSQLLSDSACLHPKLRIEILFREQG